MAITVSPYFKELNYHVFAYSYNYIIYSLTVFSNEMLPF
jgi:hypothetical protein